MLDFHFISPTYFSFGKDTENETGRLCKKFCASKVLILYGGGSVIRSGLLERIKHSLDEVDLPHHEIGGVQPNPRVELAEEAIAFVLENNIDFVLGVGAGSVLDTAKAVAVGAANPGTDLWEFYSYQKPVTKALKVGSVMTFPATGSEASNSTVLNFTKQGLKRGLNNDLLRPVFSILNPELTYTLPAYQTACGIVDMMSHIMERYFSNTEHVELSDRICEGLLVSIREAGTVIMHEPENYSARATLMWAATLAHNNLCGVGREQDWGCHALAHELSYRYDLAHGAALSLITIAWLRYQLPRNPHKIVQFARRVMGIITEDEMQAAKEGIVKLATFFRSLGMPLTMEEANCNPEDIPELVPTVKRSSAGTVGFYAPLNDEDIEAVYRLSCNPPLV